MARQRPYSWIDDFPFSGLRGRSDPVACIWQQQSVIGPTGSWAWLVFSSLCPELVHLLVFLENYIFMAFFIAY